MTFNQCNKRYIRTKHIRDKALKEWNEYYFNYILKHEDKINWDCISENPNITMEIIEKHINKLDFNSFSWNKFTYQNRLNEQIFGYWILENTQKRLPQMINRHIAMMFL